MIAHYSFIICKVIFLYLKFNIIIGLHKVFFMIARC